MPWSHRFAQMNTNRSVHKTHPGTISYLSCDTGEKVHEMHTQCYQMEGDGRGLTLRVQNQVEGNDCDSWSFSICFDHSRSEELALQKVILQHLHCPPGG
jgi:hypothetical protein